MTKLIPVKYGERNYPPYIETNICEVAGNFDTKEIDVNTPYSLHTEYSWGERTFSSEIINDLKGIISAQKNNIPQLWYNDKWAEDFFLFINRLIDKNQPPKVLEIHPPFNNYCGSFDIFLHTFKIFYEKYKKYYSKTETNFLIENRCGTLNTDGKFILSKYSDVLEFCKILESPKYSDIDLKIVLDYPQLFSEVYISTNNEKKKELRQKGMIIDDEILERIIFFNKEIKKYKKLIGGFHMWGKRKNKNGKWTAHQGNFNDLFSNKDKLKNDFLDSVSSTFNDNIERYFVPEVNSGDKDLLSIINDMEKDKRFEFPYKK
jgi:hypothetical protein